jgi:16S rRNA (guanine527-N7)-methyltransferase
MNREDSELFRQCADELGIELDSNALGQFGLFAAELKKWNSKINLTSLRDDRDIVVKHFADSMTLIGVLGEAGSLLDIGSGGGFPAIPLKILLPKLSVVSVDSVEKKILFQRHAARLLRLLDFTAVHARAEGLVEKYSSHFDCIVSRAFSDLPYFCLLSLASYPGLRVDYRMKGKDGREEADGARERLADLGAMVTDCIHLKLPVSGDERYLIVLKKSTPVQSA